MSLTSTSRSGTASVSCPVGKTLLSGGGVVTTNDTLDKVRLISSYPSAINTWTVVGSALIVKGKTWSVRAYAICG
ncbi:MAG TPA: hypothetical protein VGJ46_10150 [Candidatus Limnocylindrales bacterium]